MGPAASCEEAEIAVGAVVEERDWVMAGDGNASAWVAVREIVKDWHDDEEGVKDCGDAVVAGWGWHWGCDDVGEEWDCDDGEVARRGDGEVKDYDDEVGSDAWNVKGGVFERWTKKLFQST